ncbi:MAG: hypothetical protein HY378_00935 [Candidatus Brennerbacteria bacterium]|nr:hypothetical protein [Candidatus Brennerbacteria bacterium]
MLPERGDMTQTCKQCENQFEITPDDLGFYEKMRVPPPNLCPDCRFRRRVAFRNEMTLYNRTCNLCSKPVVSMFNTKSPYTIYCSDCWFSDKWDPYSYATDYDESKPFFEQLKELSIRVPKLGLYVSAAIVENINSDYTNFAGGNKDCYLVFNAGPGNENCAYSRGIQGRDVFDCYYANEVERVYECVNVNKSAGTAWGQNSSDCIDSWFLMNCVGCQNCFGCVNLRHKSYYFLNKQLDKNEWKKRTSEIVGSYKKIQEFTKEFEKFSLRFPRRESTNLKTVNCSGNYITESKNCSNCFEITFSEDMRYAFSVKYAKDCQDVLGHCRSSELILEGVGTGFYGQRVIGSWAVETSQDVGYSFAVKSSKNCFGCDGLRNAEYCILNRRYPKEDYESLRKEIIGGLKSIGEYGLFMPPALALFGYNETIGQDNLPMVKDEALKQGFKWEDDVQITKGKGTLKPEQIPDRIEDVTDSILKEVLVCVSCGRNYKITKQEFDFYKRMNIPVPRQCFFCRHADRLRRRGPFKLYSRKCAKCSKEIQTTYAPERPEIVYCETCYQKEVV